MVRVGLLLFASMCAMASGTAFSEVPDAGTAFIGGTVITMSKAGVLTDHTVVVRGDSIVAIGPSDSVEVPPEVEKINARGRFLLPGMIDMHVHLSGRPDLASNLRYGVTSVLQMGGQRGAISDFLSLRDEIESGDLHGPRMFLTGPMFGRIGLKSQTTAYAIAALEQVPDVVEKHVAAGYDFFKVHNFTPGSVHRTLVDSASLPVIGHIPLAMTMDDVLSSGQVMVAHAMIFYYSMFADPSCSEGFWQCMAKVHPDMSVLDDLVARIASSGIAVTANLSILAAEQSNDDNWDAVLQDPEFQLQDPSLQARWRSDNPHTRTLRAERRKDIDNQKEFVQSLVARLVKRGVPVLAGTDAGVEGLFPGRALHLELSELVSAGLTPAQALEAATSTAGGFLGAHVPRAGKLGRIEVGYAADLVLLDANPLVDIANSVKLRGTMSRGVWHAADALDRARRESP